MHFVWYRSVQVAPTLAPQHVYLTGLHTFSSRPLCCASLFSESSASPIARTKPQSAKVVFSPGMARPLASTLAMEIWTDPWSSGRMRRLVALHLRGM